MQSAIVDRKARVDAILEKANSRASSRFSISNTSIYRNRNENEEEKKLGRDRRAVLDSILNTKVSLPSQRGRRPAPPATAEPLQKGWYEVGWREKKVYRTSELVMYWRLLWKRKFRTSETPSYNPYLKQHLLKWLQEDGYKLVEAVFEYAFDHWELLKVRYSIDADGPELRIVYGFRRAIYGEMMKSKGRASRSINNRWTEDTTDEDTAEYSAEFVAI